MGNGHSRSRRPADLVQVCREGEAWAIAAGLYLGGARPVVMIQCTGLFEVGRRAAKCPLQLQIPLFSLIGYRSYLSQTAIPNDSARTFTEPILKAWGIDYRLIDVPSKHARSSRITSTARRRANRGVHHCRGERLDVYTAAAGKTNDADPTVEILHAARKGEVVVTTMGGAREWQKLGEEPARLDLRAVEHGRGDIDRPGHRARPAQRRRVVVCSGDGSMLMNLGSLVTIGAQAPANLTVIVFDNGVYEVTRAAADMGSRPCFGPIPRPSILPRWPGHPGSLGSFSFDAVDAWEAAVPEVLRGPGPTFVSLHVDPVVDGGAAGLRRSCPRSGAGLASRPDARAMICPALCAEGQYAAIRAGDDVRITAQ